MCAPFGDFCPFCRRTSHRSGDLPRRPGWDGVMIAGCVRGSAVRTAGGPRAAPGREVVGSSWRRAAGRARAGADMVVSTGGGSLNDHEWPRITGTQFGFSHGTPYISTEILFQGAVGSLVA